VCAWGLQVVLVRWNEPFQKLATCDTDGGIFVWIQYEGRWSVELVNDRGAQVRRVDKQKTQPRLRVLYISVSNGGVCTPEGYVEGLQGVLGLLLFYYWL